jgi:hypothetical protein
MELIKASEKKRNRALMGWEGSDRELPSMGFLFFELFTVNCPFLNCYDYCTTNSKLNR